MKTQLLAGSFAVIFGMGLVACGDDDGGNNTGNQNNNNSVVTCGDNLAAGSETCDGMDLRANDCTSVPGGFTGGTLACNTFCDGWDTSGCTSDAQCGDSVVEGMEVCDLANLDSNDCTTVPGGFIGGTLVCGTDCLTWDTSLCTGATCGNDTVEGMELCDGTDHGMDDCTTIGLGFIGGTLDCNGTCDGWITTGCTSPTCGDSTVEGNEICDTANLDSNDCTTIPGGYTGGTLACGSDCISWDTTNCTGGPVCGDGTQDVGEECDLTDLNSNDCTTVPGGFTGGTLACSGACTFDTTGCTGGPGTCGDGTINGTEDCDGADLGTADCTTVPGGYTGGTLTCNSSCGFNVSGCTGGTSTCGNNTAEGGELCDGTDTNGEDCTTVGPFTGGTLGCNANCMIWDASQCTVSAPVCGNGVQEGFESCDGADLQGLTCADAGFTGGTVSCTAGCQFDLSTCTGGQAGWTCPAVYYAAADGCDCGCGIIDPDCADSTSASCDFCNDVGSCNGFANCGDPGDIINPSDNAVCLAPTCGNNIAEGVEICDGADMRGLLCESIGQGFSGGTLACDASCGLDTSGCTAAVCGDNAVGGFEFCDGSDLDGFDCVSLGLGFGGGTLACDGSCNFDTTGCTAPVCGDNIIGGNELCDGADLGGADCTTIGQGFVGGTLVCNGTCDDWDTTQCTAPTCGNNTAEPGEHCDGADMGAATGAVCTDGGFTGGTITCTAGCLLDFSTCTGGQPGWTCPQIWYGAGDGCDCGCGVIDPDCAGDTTGGACAWCGEMGSCSTAGAGCPGTIDPASNHQCI